MGERVDSTLFRQVLGHFASGVTVIAALDGAGPVGVAVGAFFSVSLEPPLVGFCIKHSSSTWPAIRAADSFCVSILGDQHEEISRRFSESGVDRFATVPWEPAPSGAPRLVEALAWLDCRVDAVHAAGDHDICVGRVEALEVSGRGGPLIFYRGGYGGFAP